MAIPDVIKGLLENGVHFGHLSKHWNPKMKKFIFGKKKNIYIIDLEKTAQKLEEAKEFIRKVILDGKKVLFVSTKRQLRELIKEKGQECGMPYIAERWVGGFLTNFSTIRDRVKRYVSLREQKERGDFENMPRKEVGRLERQLSRMEKNYSGVMALEDFPGCIFVIDPKKEASCIKEATRSDIPIVGLIDTDADPELLNYPIPGNDDAIKSVRYIISSIAETIKEASKELNLKSDDSDDKKMEEDKSKNAESSGKA